MEQVYKETIEKTFNRCIGLQSALQTTDSLLKEGALSSLVHQSGLRRSFIEEHLTEILAL